MHPLLQSRAPEPTVAQFIALDAVSAPQTQRLNRASRGLNSQLIAGASRSLNRQELEGAPRRLNSQSVAGAVIAARVRSSSFLPQACVIATRTARSGSCCSAVTSCKSVASPARGAPRALPNPSVKPSPNGGPPGPGRRYAVHFRQPGPGVPPSVPAYLER